MSLDSIDAVNGLVSNTTYNQNSEKEDRGTANTKKAEKYKGKGYFGKGKGNFLKGGIHLQNFI